MKTLAESIVRLVRGTFSRPGLGTVAVVSLAFGIGANSAIFSLVDALAFRPLPLREPERLMAVFQGTPELPLGALSYLNWVDLAAASTTLPGLAAYSVRGTVIGGGDGPAEMMLTSVVSPGYFDLIGIAPAAGTLPSATRTAAPSSPPQVVLSHGLWQRRYGGDPGIVGRTVSLNTQPVTVVGVAPATFGGMQRHLDVDLWIPMSTWLQISPGNESEFERRDLTWLTAFGRLAPGASADRAAEELAALGGRLAAAYPDANDRMLLTAHPLAQAGGESMTTFGALLLGLAGLVLLVSCANVANLLLVQGESRRQELALRAALGAGRGRLTAQMLAEAAVLGVAGVVAALLLAETLIGLLPSLLPPSSVPLGYDFRLDGRVVAFTIGVAGLSVLGFGLVPALRATRLDLMCALRAAGPRTGERRRRIELRDLLVVGQMAVCLSLLTVAGLLVQNLRKVGELELGFERGELLLVQIAPSISGYGAAEAAQLYEALRDDASAIPGVRAASWTRRVPLAPSGGGASREVVVPGYAAPAGRDTATVRFTAVGPGYFRTMGTRLLAGRSFGPQDGPDGTRTAVVNGAMARTFWGTENVVGRRFEIIDGDGRIDCEIVGVAETGKYLSLTEDPMPYLFLPLAQWPSSDMTLVVSASTTAAAVAEPLRAAVRNLDPDLPILQMLTLDDHLALPLYEHRMSAGLLSALGGTALLLAVVGLYGVVAYHVRRRTSEIGVRIALGARRLDVVRLVLARSGALLAAGLAVGTLGALLGGRVVASMLYRMSPYQPAVLGAVIVLLAAVAGAASMLPALRAANIDPLQALRDE